MIIIIIIHPFFLRKFKNKQADILEGTACFTKNYKKFFNFFFYIYMHIYFIKVLFIREV